MRLRVNGRELVVEAPLSIADLLRREGLENRRIAVERNRVIAKRELWAETRLEDGDEIEILQFVGGGSE